MSYPRIAVVGAGIFGVTTALRLSKQGYRVHLFETKKQILMAASGINQYRLHRGYHYHRSLETALSCRNSSDSFKEEYADAVRDNAEHYYCVAKCESLTSAEELFNFCEELGLEYTIAPLDLIRQDTIDVCVRVRESRVDPESLRSICWNKLDALNIEVRLNTEATKEVISQYDVTVVAAYSGINSLLEDFSEHQRVYQYELCEKPVVRLPKQFQNKSIVVVDGPFMCVDPFGDTGLFVLGNVVHAIHQTNVGKTPVANSDLDPYLDRGVIKNPRITNFNSFISSAIEFIPGLEAAEHLGSMYAIRTVLPDTDDTDERPTLVQQIEDKVITIFSGKIGTCVEAANQVVNIVNNKFKGVMVSTDS